MDILDNKSGVKLERDCDILKTSKQIDNWVSSVASNKLYGWPAT